MLLRPNLCPGYAIQVFKSNWKAHGMAHGTSAKRSTPNEQTCCYTTYDAHAFLLLSSKAAGKKCEVPEFGS